MSHTENQPATVVLKLLLCAGMGVAFVAAVYIRFYSGLIPVEDRPAWPAYAAYFAISVALWLALESRFGLAARCLSERSLARWLWSLAQLDLLALGLVSAAAFFWRGYSFSRYTVAMFWALHVLLSLAAAWAVRGWTSARLSEAPPELAFDYVFSKRLIDLAVSALALAALAPLLAAIAAVIAWRSGRPVLLIQERVGRGGRRFRLFKFRTLPLASLAGSDHQWAPPPTDAWGRFLRSTGLDELPQLVNVLKGEMSLVGPRPERPHFVEQFRGQLPFYSTRHRLEAGITGWAQVNGWRGDTSIRHRVEHDLYYLRNWSLALDFRILWMTLADFLERLRGAAHARSF